MGLEDRIARLEAAAGRQQEDAGSARQRRMWDRSYHEQGNARRELMGLEPEPLPPGLEPTAADIVETLSTTIPHFRRFGSWGYGEGKEFLDAWENTLLEQLSELQRGAKSDG